MSDTLIHERKTGIGGSDVGAILGCSPYKSAIDVYMDKLGLAPAAEETAAMRWGTFLEEPIANYYRELKGVRYERNANLFRHPKYDFLIAHPDRIVYPKKKVLEVKAPGFESARFAKDEHDKWGEPGTDQVPQAYLLQCAHYMLVTGIDECDLAALIGGQDFRVYTLHRDKELEEALIEKLVNFWEDHILKRVPPDATPDQFRDYLAARYPKHSGPMLNLDGRAERLLLTELKAARSACKSAEDAKTVLENKLKELIGEGEGACASDLGKVTWKKNKDSEVTDWQKAFFAIVDAIREGEPIAKSQIEAVVAQHTKTKPGARVFRATFSGDKE